MFNTLRKKCCYVFALCIVTLTSGFAWSDTHPPEVSQQLSDVFIQYCESLVDKQIIDVTHLESLCECDQLVNPLTEFDAHGSSECFVHKKQLDIMVAKYKDAINLEQVRSWAIAKKAELEERHKTQEEVHEKTRELHRPMRFVPILAGNYTNQLDGAVIEIKPGIEIQETPVTQYQWACVMGNNPSHFTDGFGSEEITFDDQRLTIQPDHPVENVSYDDVQEFIEKINEQDKDYYYALPSLGEYQALLTSTTRSGLGFCSSK